jgi:hypothetical protein
VTDDVKADDGNLDVQSVEPMDMEGACAIPFESVKQLLQMLMGTTRWYGMQSSGEELCMRLGIAEAQAAWNSEGQRARCAAVRSRSDD